MSDRVGRQLGNYKMLRHLGNGGFAEVYLGEHIYLKTSAAIKVLQTRLSGPQDLDDFLKEAQTIARLQHPHIVRVMDFGVENEVPFLVMDYAIGGTMRQRYPKGTLVPLATVVSSIRQVADALQYAHDEKLIHRDVKPENILLDQHHNVLLSDFGIALVAQSSRYQNTQEVIGTAAYMSPEQILGHPRAASDQYSLGVVAYEWLTGTRPFEGSLTEVWSQHMFAPPPPPRGKVPTIFREVEEVVMTALAKDSKQRFVNVRAFATALEQASRPTTVFLPRSPMMVPPSNHTSQSTQLAPSLGQLAPSIEFAMQSPLTIPPTEAQAPSNQTLQPTGVPRASRRTSRRSVILGLGLAGLIVVGGGIALLSHTQGLPVFSPSSTSGSATLGSAVTSMLQGAVTTPPSQVNLTSEGTNDWIHWGLYTNSLVDRKNGVPAQISTFSTIGNATAGAYGNNGIAYSWSDGTPDQTIVNTTTGVYVIGINNGFSFSVSASTTIQTLRVYVDVWYSQAKFTASLTDGSGLVYTDKSLNNAGGTTQAVYTLTFKSSSPGQQLTITFVAKNTYYSIANVALEAATLQ